MNSSIEADAFFSEAEILGLMNDYLYSDMHKELHGTRPDPSR